MLHTSASNCLLCLAISFSFSALDNLVMSGCLYCLDIILNLFLSSFERAFHCDAASQFLSYV